MLWGAKRALAALRWRRDRAGLDSDRDRASSSRRRGSGKRVSCEGVEAGSGLERVDVHLARQRGHVHVKW